MQTIINNKRFEKKIKGKYSPEYIESIIEKLSYDPKMGKKFNAVNNLFKLGIGLTTTKKAEYSLVYYYSNKNEPIYIINIFKKREKDLLSKVIFNLVNDKTVLD